MPLICGIQRNDTNELVYKTKIDSQIHVDVWQKPTQLSKEIILQLRMIWENGNSNLYTVM